MAFTSAYPPPRDLCILTYKCVRHGNGDRAIDIGVVANAAGSTARANATIHCAISHFAIAHVTATSNASSLIDSINVHATAGACGATNAAYAFASNQSAIYQDAIASDVNALMCLHNGGDIAIYGIACAAAGAYASALTFNSSGI